MFCYVRKQPIAKEIAHAVGMREKLPINEVLAANLAFYMAAAGIDTQPALAARSKVSQRTISNYLNPTRRAAAASGKAGSAKLTEIERIASALGVEVWQLLRQGTPAEMRAWGQVEAAFRELAGGAQASRQPASLTLHDSGSKDNYSTRVTT